jgi:hypothetical protein
MRSTLPSIVREADRFSEGFVNELEALAGRKGEMRHPVKVGVRKRRRRQPDREPRGHRMQRSIHDVGKCRHQVRVAYGCHRATRMLPVRNSPVIATRDLRRKSHRRRGRAWRVPLCCVPAIGLWIACRD